MGKLLVIVCGKQFIHPFFILSSDIDGAINRLKDESKNCTYVYAVYKYYEKRDIYLGYIMINNGVDYQFDGYHIMRND